MLFQAFDRDMAVDLNIHIYIPTALIIDIINSYNVSIGVLSDKR